MKVAEPAVGSFPEVSSCRNGETAPLCPGTLLHMGSCTAVDQTLSRLARAGCLLRVCRGVYMRPVETRFGPCAPSIEKAVASLSASWGETIVPCGASAANVLGLTTQNPVLSVYLTSGPNRRLRFRCPRSTLAPCAALATRGTVPKAGDAVRALAAPWHGSPPERSRTLSRRSSPGSPTTTWPSWRRRARSCWRGWRSR